MLATGVVDELPDVPGLRERWGATVLHCRYCHGYGASPYPTLHVDDLAGAYVAALERATAGARYDLVGSTLVTREVAGAVSHAVGTGGRTVSLTSDAARAAWGLLAGVLIGGPAVIALRAVVKLGWAPRGPSLPYELVHGTLHQHLLAPTMRQGRRRATRGGPDSATRAGLPGSGSP